MIKVLSRVDEDGVAVITIQNPPVNALSPSVLLQLKERLDEVYKNDCVKAIVITGSNGKFSGGFDLTATTSYQKKGTMSMTPELFVVDQAVGDGPKPIVAAIQGLALGGGLELAMSCNARIAAPKTQLGLPELQLGLIPGFGGTQRLPRLVGLQKAIEMMLTSKPISAEAGAELGLVDQVVSPSELINVATKWALDIYQKKRPILRTLERNDKLDTLGEARAVLKFAREQVKKTAPNVLHPVKCLDAIEFGILNGGKAGTLKEKEYFREVMLSDTSRALIHFFFAQRQTAKVKGVTDSALRPKSITKVAVIGGGLMGSGITTALVSAGISVILKEVNENFLKQGLNRVRGNFASQVKKGKLRASDMEKRISLVKGTLSYEDFHDLDLVIEAVIENVPLKQQIFVDLEKYCSPSCILSTNTSTIDLNLVGAKTRSQDRIIGAHFFSPAHVMPLLEIVRTEKTSSQSIVDLLALSKAIRKTPVVVRNCTGFAVNRVFFPYTMAACMLVDLGVDPYRIDGVIKAFGMPMGPFRLSDLVGMGVASAVGQQYVIAYSDRVYKSTLIPSMLAAERFGEKNGKGFYNYDSKRKQSPAPELKDFLEKSRKSAGLIRDGKPLSISNQEIVEMIFFPVVNEGCRVLDEGVVVKASDLDIASVMAMGFPPYRGGVIFFGDTCGPKYIVDKLQKWSALYGSFFKPCDYLVKSAQSSRRLGDVPEASSHASKL